MRSEIWNHNARIEAIEAEPTTRGHLHTPIRFTGDIDSNKAAELARIRRERRRPELNWRAVLESRPEGAVRIDVTTGERV